MFPISKARLTANIVSSIAQLLASGLAMFLFYRLLLSHLGATKLGLWALMSATFAAGRMVDFGVGASATRFVALSESQGNVAETRRVIDTSVLATALFVSIGMVIAFFVFGGVLINKIPDGLVSEASAVLPVMIASFWLHALASVYQGAIDGAHRAFEKNCILLAGSVVLVGMASFLVQRFGVMGAAWAQFSQAAFVYVAAMLLSARRFGVLPFLPTKASLATFRRLAGYAGGYQVANLAIMICDPLAKYLVSQHAGLAATAYYDMATQLVVRIRAILLAGYSQLVPMIASAGSGESRKAAYRMSYRLVWLVVVPAWLVFATVVPMVSALWLGRVNEGFIVFVYIGVAASVLNALEVPAHYYNIGAGRIRANVIAHLFMAAAIITVGDPAGKLMSAVGVASVVSIATVLAGLFVQYGVHYRVLELGTSELLPRDVMPVVSFCFVAAFAALGVQLISSSDACLLLLSAISGLLMLFVVGVAYWSSDYVRVLLRSMASRS